MSSGCSLFGLPNYADRYESTLPCNDALYGEQCYRLVVLNVPDEFAAYNGSSVHANYSVTGLDAASMQIQRALLDPGQTQSQVGDLTCTPCAAGQIQISRHQHRVHRVPPGFRWIPSDTLTFESACERCSAGKYQTQPGQQACVACSAGKWHFLHWAIVPKRQRLLPWLVR